MSDDRRALVLGGGGLTGVAWMYGLLAGLLADGVDLRDADLVVGTSAGSVVGANLAVGRDPAALARTQLAAPSGEIAAALGLRLAVRYGLAALAGPRDATRVRARIGRLALEAETVPEADRIAVIRSRLDGADWPADRDLRVTAVDAHTGAFRAFGRDDGVELATAVAASCAVPGVWPPVTATGTRWIDGGARSAANADLAAGTAASSSSRRSPWGSAGPGRRGCRPRRSARWPGSPSSSRTGVRAGRSAATRSTRPAVPRRRGPAGRRRRTSPPRSHGSGAEPGPHSRPRRIPRAGMSARRCG
ncbi:patatin-like phospholipase family protein [Pseudonocardia sp. ICBG601]|uniref:patatin-like phospholipase family protein n=1 Tax=Pseudonocardia sp. ICBG601 TaxID=2846759 RepID=UPI001CF65D13|nr:patatin-like phospholipase family protein [Pseudonocardia sp. ICBG601]